MLFVLLSAVSSEIHYVIKDHIKHNQGKCEVFTAPYDVRLDYRTVVQPDILIVCDKDKLDDKRCNGAPDFVIEIASPNTSVDYSIKLELYKKFGVKEYWIVDPAQERTTVFLFGDTTNISFYAFDQPVPVHIYQNKLEIIISELF